MVRLTGAVVRAAQQAVEGRRPRLVPPVAASLSPVVKYHGLARRDPTACGFLMRPLLNGGTLAGLEIQSNPMALHFAMEVECGDEPAARAVARHFEGLSLPVEGSVLSCRTKVFRDSENNWWASAAPPGTSRGLPGYDNPTLQSAACLSEIGRLLYDRLRTAPSFRYALVGIEASEFRYFSELDADVLTVDGLVLTRELWVRLGQHPAFEPFATSYVWLPYVGEKDDL